MSASLITSVPGILETGLDVTILVQTEEHGALETITLGQDPGDGWYS